MFLIAPIFGSSCALKLDEMPHWMMRLPSCHSLFFCESPASSPSLWEPQHRGAPSTSSSQLLGDFLEHFGSHSVHMTPPSPCVLDLLLTLWLLYRVVRIYVPFPVWSLYWMIVAVEKKCHQNSFYESRHLGLRFWNKIGTQSIKNFRIPAAAAICCSTSSHPTLSGQAVFAFKLYDGFAQLSGVFHRNKNGEGIHSIQQRTSFFFLQHCPGHAHFPLFT